MALVRPTPETAKHYAASLERAAEDADTAIRVLDETAIIAVTSIGLQAACQKVAYEDAMEDIFRQVDDAQEEGT